MVPPGRKTCVTFLCFVVNTWLVQLAVKITPRVRTPRVRISRTLLYMGFFGAFSVIFESENVRVFVNFRVFYLKIIICAISGRSFLIICTLWKKLFPFRLLAFILDRYYFTQLCFQESIKRRSRIRCVLDLKIRPV